MDNAGELANQISDRAERYRDTTANSLSRMVRIPSLSCGEADVVAEIDAIASEFGLSNRRVDGLGNMIIQVGHGPRVLAIDAHIDTVDVGDPDQWAIDPFSGLVRDGYVHGRGSVDQEGGAASMLTAARILTEMEYDGGFTLLFTFTVMEEDCDGLCWNYIIESEGIKPDFAVITEPTNLGVYRGHRGRMEMDVRFTGISAHGSAPARGLSAISIASVSALKIAEMNETLRPDEFLGAGSAVVSRIQSSGVSLCAVPDGCEIHIDRRLTWGETRDSAVAEIETIARESFCTIAGSDTVDPRLEPRVSVPLYDVAGYKGVSHPQESYFPTWKIAENHPLVAAGVRTATLATGSKPSVGKWTFSTNGVSLCGKHGVPTIGYGPGNEVGAHAPNEKTPVDHLQTASAFYALLPFVLE